MQIKTDRLILRPLGMEYLDSVFEYASDYDTTKYMINLPNEAIEETIDFLRGTDAEWAKENPAFYEFAILFGDRHIGAVCIYLDDSKTEGEVGWILHKEYWNRGLATEAAEALFAFAMDTLHVKHLTAHCDAENVGSYRVMEKLGMKRTDASGGRRNKSSDEERMEYRYEFFIG